MAAPVRAVEADKCTGVRVAKIQTGCHGSTMVAKVNRLVSMVAKIHKVVARTASQVLTQPGVK